MDIFLTLMIVGLVGLGLMAVPGMGRHGHAAHAPAHTGGHAGVHAGGHAHIMKEGVQQNDPGGASTVMPTLSPLVIFTILTCFGAYGYGAMVLLHLPLILAGLLAALPTLITERYLFRPMWGFLMSFEGNPASPMEMLTFSEAKAVTNFHEGKGLVEVDRDGRTVQLSAHLVDDQVGQTVHVGDKLRVEDVDAAAERVKVSVL